MVFEDAVALVRRAVDAGINMFDTGNYNSGPHSEGLHADVLLGRILESAGLGRTDYVLVMQQWLWTLAEEAMADSVRRNLSRVGVDHADVLLLGHYNQGYREKYGVDLYRVVADVAEIIGAGSANSWAFCNWPASDARLAYDFAVAQALPLPLFVQMKYSIARRSIPEGEPYSTFLRETGIGFQACDVLEGGVLVGRKPTRRIGRDVGGVIADIERIAADVRRVASALGASSAQLAIAFAFTNPATTNVLVGMSRLDQLVENLGGWDVFARNGDSIRSLVADLCVDFGVVDPNEMS